MDGPRNYHTKKVRQRKLDKDKSHLHVSLKKKKVIQMNLFTKQKQIYSFQKQTYGYQRGNMLGGGINEEFGINIYTLLSI